MRKLFIIFLVSSFALVSCAPVAAPNNQALQIATSSLVATLTPSVTPCTLLHFPVTPEAALGAEFEGRGHVSGPSEAPVTIIVFSDYQCLSCAFLAAGLRQIRLTHPNDVRLIYLDAPVAGNDKSILSIQAVEAAAIQRKFWEMHDLLFEKQGEWISIAPADFEEWVLNQAVMLGMDSIQFRSDFHSQVVADRLQQAVQSFKLQPFTPPLLYINSSTPYNSLADFASLDTVVRMDALVARQFSACPPMSVDPFKQYIVTLHTGKGNVVLQLFPDKAPMAVNNFLFLARSRWYDGSTFYRVIPGDRVMSGDPSGTGMGNPGYLFETEIVSGLNFNKPGIVALDNDGPGTNGSRFFITLDSNSELTGQYTIIGQVLNGMDILAALTPRNPNPGTYSPQGDEIVSISVEEK